MARPLRTASAATRSHVAALAVPVSLLGLAGAGYLVLIAGGRTLPAPGFAALSSFYLLANTVGRGTFAALELELTRAVARVRAEGGSVAGVCHAVLLRGSAMLAGVLVLVAVAGPLLVRSVGDGTVVVLLGVSAVGLALSSAVRGPLAGEGRYALFSASLASEALTAVLAAAALVATGTEDVRLWAGALAAAPFAGVLLVALVDRRWMSALPRPRVPLPPSARTTLPTLLSASVLFLCSQAVWNLAPVIVTARAGADLDAAAGFAATAVLLRGPVMLFPAVQALVLPRLVRDEAGGRAVGGRSVDVRTLGAGAVVAVVWLIGATVLTPVVTAWVFTVTSPTAPTTTAVLAASILAGTVAQFVQARMLARARAAAVASIWLGALVVLLVVATLPGDAALAAAGAQLAATVVALVAMAVVARRRVGR